ncbi:MAG TPA: hypothetical protein EYH44_05110 [Thermoprotei archaeon]|nr:hypothetical protein [Thermoprotei archaeon]
MVCHEVHYARRVLRPNRFNGIGEYRRITANKLPEAEIAFIDEIFKANSAILNSMLSIIKERIYHDGGIAVKVPLNTLIAASNENAGG